MWYTIEFSLLAGCGRRWTLRIVSSVFHLGVGVTDREAYCMYELREALMLSILLSPGLAVLDPLLFSPVSSSVVSAT